MTPETYGILRDIVFFIILPVMVFMWGRDRKQVADAIDTRFQTTEHSILASFALRDQRLNALDKRIEDASDRASREGGRITEKMEEIRERLVWVESKVGGRREHDA